MAYRWKWWCIPISLAECVSFKHVVKNSISTLTCASVAILSKSVSLCFKSATSELTDSLSMEINLWEHVFTSLYRTVIRVVLALFLSINVSYWPGLAAAGDSGASRGFTGEVDRGKLFPCNQNCCTWTSNHQGIANMRVNGERIHIHLTSIKTGDFTLFGHDCIMSSNGFMWNT